MKFKALIEDVSQEFNFGTTQNSFEELAKSWIGKNHIVSHKVNPNRANVIVVTYDQEQSLYDILRFFVGGEKWQVSVDFQQGNIEGMAEKLLNY